MKWAAYAFYLNFSVWSVMGASGTVFGQTSSLFLETLPPPGAAMPDKAMPSAQALAMHGSGRPQHNVLDLKSGSWIYVPVSPGRVIRIHDRVTVRVDELARTRAEGEVERRRDSQYDGIVQDWFRLESLRALKPGAGADGDPRVRGKLQQLYRAEGELTTRESVALNIACTVEDIRPNGDLVLEGHKQIRVNNDSWEISLAGICRHEDVGPDNVALSRDIANLKITKRERGHVRDGYKRGWLLRWFDEFHPF